MLEWVNATTFVLLWFIIDLILCVINLWFIPRLAKKAIINGVDSELGDIIINKISNKMLESLKGDEGKKLMEQMIVKAVDSFLNGNIEVKQEDGTLVNVPILEYTGDMISGKMTTYITKIFAGEKGVFAKEMDGIAKHLTEGTLPEGAAVVLGFLEPYLKKRPWLAPIAMKMIEKFTTAKQSKPQTSGGGGSIPR